MASGYQRGQCGTKEQLVGGVTENEDVGERLLLNHKRRRDSWPLEENSIPGQKRGLITQSFYVIKFY